MKAIVSTAYGPPDVLQLQEVVKPIPKENEILIKVYATTVSQGDRRFRIPKPFAIRLLNGLIKPKLIKILGLELAGEVIGIGKEVKQYEIGDEVFAFTGFYFGAYASYKCMQVNGDFQKHGIVTKKPKNLSFEEAAAVPCGGITALGLVKKAEIQKGKKVLIYGASGSIGTYAVQFAKHFGGQVTGVCSTKNLEMVKAIGADEVIDYTEEDFTKNGQKYDVIIDAVHKKSSRKCKKSLRKKGIFLSAHSKTNPKLEDLILIKELIEAKKLKPVIDKIYPLEEVVEAHRYVDLGHKIGNVVLVVNNSKD